MRYDRYDFFSSFNASGNKGEMAVNELSKIVGTNKEAAIAAMQAAGVPIPANSNTPFVIKSIRNNKGNHKMIRNLSALIVLVNRSESKFSHAEGGKTNIFKSIGNWFKKDESGTSGFGRFFKKNKKDIGNVGSHLLGSVGNKTGTTPTGTTPIGTTGVGYPPANTDDDKDKGKMKMGTKIAIGFGVIAVIAVIVVAMRRKK